MEPITQINTMLPNMEESTEPISIQCFQIWKNAWSQYQYNASKYGRMHGANINTMLPNMEECMEPRHSPSLQEFNLIKIALEKG